MSDVQITATHTRVGVNMGDHAQDVTNSIAVTPNTTLGELVTVLYEKQYVGYQKPSRLVPRDGDFILIRVASPIPEGEETQ